MFREKYNVDLRSSSGHLHKGGLGQYETVKLLERGNLIEVEFVKYRTVCYMFIHYIAMAVCFVQCKGRLFELVRGS